jgi:phosphate transport system permease protein
MTDATLSPAAPRRFDVTSDAARARVAARKASETRFRAYGLIAIFVAAAFLVFLLTDVVRRALPAFTINSFVTEVTLKAEDLNPNNATRLNEILGSGNFDTPVVEALRTAMPQMSSRGERRQLRQVLSQTAAGDHIRALVSDDQSVIGKSLVVPAILDPNVDLYLKGAVTDVTWTSGETAFAPSDTKETITLSGGRIGSLADGNFDNKTSTHLLFFRGGAMHINKATGDSAEGTVLVPLNAEDTSNAWRLLTIEVPAGERKVTDQQIAIAEILKAKGLITSGFNWDFLVGKDSAQPETAGILSGVVGSALMLLVTLLVCLPLGVAAAIYLEEFAPKNRFTRLIEINVNNLAAVPSIIFGLLGMAVFINMFGLGRGTLIVGGLVLALLVLPTIIIASRAALRAVPPSIREAALGVGASKQQAVFQHVLPLAMPGIMTGTIIGMAHALGETAPLMMIGMLASAPDVPTSVMSVGSAIPSTIYTWYDQAEAGFRSRAAAAIIVLLMFLFVMNGLAIWLRKRFERKW